MVNAESTSKQSIGLRVGHSPTYTDVSISLKNLAAFYKLYRISASKLDSTEKMAGLAFVWSLFKKLHRGPRLFGYFD